MTNNYDELGVIRLRGSERLSFLQGQLTQDTSLLTPDAPLLAGWTTAKGRLRCVCWIIEWQDACWLILPSSLVATLSRQLQMYVLRADVLIDSPNTVVSALPRDAAAALLNNDKLADNNPINYCFKTSINTLLVAATALPELVLQLSDPANDGGLQAPPANWRLAYVRAGMPVVFPDTADSFVPQMLNLDLLGGISFNKGCYVGQEIVARTQNLGRIKRRMYRYQCKSELAPAPGAILYSDGNKAAAVVDAVACDGQVDLLAVVPIERLAATMTLDAEGKLKLERIPLPYEIPA